MSLTVDQVIETYMKFRKKKETIESEAKIQVNRIKENMTKLESWLKEKADTDGVTSFKTNHGMVFLTTNDYARVSDWDAMLGFILENEAYDLFEKSVSKTAVRGYIDMNKAVPAGVTYGTKLVVNVLKHAPQVNFIELEALRKRMLLSVTDLVSILGISRTSYYTWRADDGMRKSNFNKINSKIDKLKNIISKYNWPNNVLELDTQDRKAKLIELLNN